MTVDITALTAFIVRAKAGTYVGDGEHTSPCRSGSHDLRFTDGEWTYHDSYFGGTDFIGEEVVYFAEQPVWAMNYYGLVMDESVLAGDVYRFLQKAMQHLGAERPFRGPDEYEEGDFVYKDTSEGDLNQFEGEETIFFQKKQVYLLVYHGGKVG